MFSTTPRIGAFSLRNNATDLPAIDAATCLGRHHNHHARQRHKLRGGHRRVARARGQVHQQVVQRAPTHIGEQLAHRARHNRTAPHRRLFLLQQEADGHHRHPVAAYRDNLPRLHQRMLALTAHHLGDAGTINVGIKQPDPCARLRQRDREVHRYGGLADPALAAGDRNHMLDFGQEVFRGEAAPAHLRRHLHMHRRHARQLRNQPLRLRLHLVFHGAGGRGEFNHRFDRAVAHRNLFHEPQRHDVAVQIGVYDVPQGVQNLLARYGWHGRSPAQYLAWLRVYPIEVYCGYAAGE
jgi:hypothetical protein